LYDNESDSPPHILNFQIPSLRTSYHLRSAFAYADSYKYYLSTANPPTLIARVRFATFREQYQATNSPTHIPQNLELLNFPASYFPTNSSSAVALLSCAAVCYRLFDWDRSARDPLQTKRVRHTQPQVCPHKLSTRYDDTYLA
jgi:hypothetical protein